MAKQSGAMKLVGTIGNATFYEMNGKFYARQKSSLTGRAFWKKDCFERSRQSCLRFASGNRLASRVYRWLEPIQRKYNLFCQLKKLAIAMLKEGIEEETINLALIDYALTYEERSVKPSKHERKKMKLAYAKQVRENEVIFTAGKVKQYLEARGLVHTGYFIETGLKDMPLALLDKWVA